VAVVAAVVAGALVEIAAIAVAEVVVELAATAVAGVFVVELAATAVAGVFVVELAAIVVAAKTRRLHSFIRAQAERIAWQDDCGFSSSRPRVMAYHPAENACASIVALTLDPFNPEQWHDQIMQTGDVSAEQRKNSVFVSLSGPPFTYHIPRLAALVAEIGIDGVDLRISSVSADPLVEHASSLDDFSLIGSAAERVAAHVELLRLSLPFTQISLTFENADLGGVASCLSLCGSRINFVQLDLSADPYMGFAESIAYVIEKSGGYNGPFTISQSNDIFAEFGSAQLETTSLSAVNINITETNQAPDWKPHTSYRAFDHVAYRNKVYVCILSHTALFNWTPPTAPHLWKLSLHIDD
ncbi:hypothetical protein HDU93_004549, partial [Gonapodya sp. JEL0774]